MKRPIVVPSETSASQARASDPRNSAWVSANAGSGKTHVLSQRVVRLLLGGAEPSSILCLTYTKAAAANMATRVFRDLGRWTMLEEAQLAGEIEVLEGRLHGQEKLKLARQLFARALETPGGLKIQTIHAFCEAVLHRFPLEANIAGHFEMLDARMEEALVAEARRDLLTGAAAGDDPTLGEAFATILQAAGETGLDGLMSEIVQKRDRLRDFIDAIGGAPSGFADLFEEFGYSVGQTAAEIAAEAWPDGYFTAALAQAMTDRADAAGKMRAQEFAAKLASVCAETDPATSFTAARYLFLKKAKAGVWENKSAKQIMAKGVAEHFPEFPEAFERTCETLRRAVDRVATFRMLDQTRAALTLADWLIGRYERLKSARGFLDFNDLITRTAHLLSRLDVGPWVQYKLDQGVDHILVDEAQDTSPDQWRVVEKLAEEFFTGAGARGNAHRTIFAVGDEKQSIYSFQGAEPEAFDIHRRLFARKVEAASGSFQYERLSHSFRSTEDVLKAVDLVFADPEARAGITRDPEPIEHKAIRVGDPGHVELWEQIAPEDVEEPDDWTQSIDHASAPAVRLAEIVAGTIQSWLARGEMLEGKSRKVRPGDVLILVRKRDRFMHALARGLKNRHVPVAGADRLNLRAHIAVQDLAALGRFILQPHDDLSLAALLKSPVFGLDEDDLFAVAWNRSRGVSLHEALRARARTETKWARVDENLQRWRAEADFRPAYEFYAAILGRDGVRRRMIQRLGHEAGEILDEFLNFCLAAEKAGVVGLEAFLAVLESAGPDIKRESDQTRNEVRIMTVHASKGLEAPVVFLVDNGSAPFSESHLPRLLPFTPRGGLWEGGGFLWRSSSDVANATSRTIADGIADKAREEYRRLLYVGMTRAEDRLIVCGYRGRNTPDDGIWHALVDRAFAGADIAEDRSDPGNLAVRRYRTTPARRVADAPDTPVAAVRSAEPLPASLTTALPPEPALPRPLSPSGASALIEDAGEVARPAASPVLASSEPSLAIARGIAVHRLLQSLPGVPQAERAAAAMRYLARAGADWPSGEAGRVWRSVERVLTDPAFAPVFAEGSRAEVSVMGTLSVGGRDRAIAGKIDRIAVSDERVLIVDYKTNRPPPETLAQVAPGYIAQIALYRALLTPLYPGREVAAALLFTEAARLIPLPPEALAEALARLARA